MERDDATIQQSDVAATGGAPSTAGASGGKAGCGKVILILLILLIILLWILSQCGGGKPAAEGKVVFVSSALFDGNFGGGQRILGHLEADAECQELAGGAGLDGTFKAWISGRVDTGSGPLPHGVVDRFTQSSDPYVLVDGTVVAQDWTDLTDGSLAHAIDQTETGAAVGNVVRVWTNTQTDGTAWNNSRQCSPGPSTDIPGVSTWSCGAPSWTPGDCQFESGKYGLANSTGADWTGTTSSNEACSNQFHLYCFEQ